MTNVCSSPDNNSAQILSPRRKAPIPYMMAGFNKGSLHHTLPICGLLPEDPSHIDHTREATQAMYSNITILAETVLKTERDGITPNLQIDPKERDTEWQGRTRYQSEH